MGKNYDCLFNLRYQNMIRLITDEVRREARTIPELRDGKNGAIRITIVPLSPLAEEWLGGGLSYFASSPEEANDICEREYVYKLDLLGSHTMKYVCTDGHVEPVNCYGYSALKVAYVSWERQFKAQSEKLNTPETLEDIKYREGKQYLVPENGYAEDQGVLYTLIKLDGVDFLRIYITVSGAREGREDERCALAGMLKMRDYFSTIAENPMLPDNAELSFELTPVFGPYLTVVV